MSGSIKMLYHEHEVIVKAVDTATQAGTLIGKDNLTYASTVRQLITFFRNYADKYHHFKEEEILFPEMSRKNELLAGGVIQEMMENHEDFRERLTSIESCVSDGNFETAQQKMEQYTDALLDHIAVENDEVFQAAESIFTEEELEKIGFRFLDSDSSLGNEQKEELESLLYNLKRNLYAA